MEWLPASPVNKAAKSTGFLTSNLELARVPLYQRRREDLYARRASLQTLFNLGGGEKILESVAIIKFIPPGVSSANNLPPLDREKKKRKGKGRGKVRPPTFAYVRARQCIDIKYTLFPSLRSLAGMSSRPDKK